jgi:tetratricopeptide (TPR) repeat protein
MALIGIACVTSAIVAYLVTTHFVTRASAPALSPQVARSLTSNAPVNLPGETRQGQATAEPLNTNDSVQLLNRGTELLMTGKLPEAIELYNRAAALNAEDEEAQFNLGVAYSKLARMADVAKRTNEATVFVKEAVRHYEEALRIFPEHAEAHNNLGNLLLERRRYDEAIAHYSTAIRINPDHSSAINNLGKCLALQGRTEEALVQFHEAVRLNTNYVEARYNLANACAMLGRVDEAIGELEQVLRLAPDFELAARRLTELKLRKNTPGK